MAVWGAEMIKFQEINNFNICKKLSNQFKSGN